MDRPKRLRKTGGYRHLRSFQTSTLICDGTISFCNRFIDLKSRTHDQMVQAARSGRQNIGEGNRAGAASSKSELELTNWARASQEELLLDFQDYIRQRRLPLWKKDSPLVTEIRAVAQRLSKVDPSNRTDPSDLILLDPEDDGDRARYDLSAPWLEHKDPVVCANTLICLIPPSQLPTGPAARRPGARVHRRRRLLRTTGCSPHRAPPATKSRHRPSVPHLRQEHDPPHCERRQEPRQPVLGLHRLSRVQRHCTSLSEAPTIRPIRQIGQNVIAQ